MRKIIKSSLVMFLLFFIKKLGGLKMLPIRSNMGNDGKRMSIGRKLVNDYMAEHTVDVQGDVMEIGRNVYSKLVPKDQVKSYTCLDIDEFEDVDILADIQKMPQVSDKSFDSIICTQVLEHVRNPFKAIDELHRVLRPGGRLIITVPFLNNYHMAPHDYWRYTEYGLKTCLCCWE